MENAEGFDGFPGSVGGIGKPHISGKGIVVAMSFPVFLQLLRQLCLFTLIRLALKREIDKRRDNDRQQQHKQPHRLHQVLLCQGIVRFRQNIREVHRVQDLFQYGNMVLRDIFLASVNCSTCISTSTAVS